MRSLTRRVTATAVLVLAASLMVVGVLTGAALYVRALTALDQALLAAAFAEAHPWQEQRFENDYVASPVQVRPWTPDDPRISAQQHADALRGELPVWFADDGYRTLLLVVEPEGDSTDRDEAHEHLVIVAEAPQVTVSGAILPFASAYVLVSLMSLGAASLAIRWGMRRALEPLVQASAALQRVRGLGTEARLEPADVQEVDQLIDAANDLLERLERAFTAQAGFTAQAAHELRTPVTVMKGELELALRRDRTAGEYATALKRALTEADQLADLVEGLMALTRVEAGHADTGRASEHVSQLVLHALDRERTRLDAAQCTVVVDVAADPEVRVHQGLVTTALSNVLRNVAVHAPGATVHVRTEPAQGGIALMVDDDGPGVPASERQRVLERFGRRSRTEGLGLGLALAGEVIRRHGGTVSLHDSPTGGLRVALFLPTRSPAP